MNEWRLLAIEVARFEEGAPLSVFMGAGFMVSGL